MINWNQVWEEHFGYFKLTDLTDYKKFLGIEDFKHKLKLLESIETEFKVIWSKQLVQRKGFRYGVCFIRLKEKDKLNHS